MNNKKLIITIVDGILLIAGLVFNFIGLQNGLGIQMTCNIVAILAGVVYLVMDYKKDAHLFFKLFVGFVVIKEAFAIVHMAIFEEIPLISFVLELLSYTAPLIILVVKNLGAKKSYVTSGVYVLVSLISFASILGISTSVVDQTMINTLLIYNGTRVVLAVVLFLMILAKYQDKAERGTV